MYWCDKCKNYKKCYKHKKETEEDFINKVHVQIGGCSDYKELTINAMFGIKENVKIHNFD